jgi:peptidoglycan/xylan/chitin deacetylase (PgdA/CDA1 family)
VTGGAIVEAAALRSAAAALAREEERRPQAARDQWNNWDAACVTERNRRADREPWLDRLLLGAASGGGERPRWGPDQAPFAVALSHDVDVVSRRHASLATAMTGLSRAIRATRGPGWSARQAARWAYKLASTPFQRGRDPAWAFEYWTETEARRGYRSTFFFFPESVRRPHPDDACYRWSDRLGFERGFLRVRDLMRELVNRGWEVGLHASIHAARDGDLLAEQRDAMEQAIGSTVESVRFHYLSWDSALTPELVHAAGFRADGTLGYNLDTGFRAGTAFPWRLVSPSTGAALDVVEVPLHLMDGSLVHPAALALSPLAAIAEAERLVDVVASVSGCLGINWHPNHAAIPEYRETYEAVLAAAHSRGAYGAPLGSIARRWREMVAARAGAAAQ